MKKRSKDRGRRKSVAHGYERRYNYKDGNRNKSNAEFCRTIGRRKEETRQ